VDVIETDHGHLQKDWNDGKALMALVNSLGRQVEKNGLDKLDPMTVTKKGMSHGLYVKKHKS